MEKDLFERDPEMAPRRQDHLFAWTVFILLLIGLALACWLGSFYIFGHPEKPESYKILKKLHKIDPPKRFELTAAPPGEFLSAQKLYERYIGYSRLQLQNENDELLRNYISNYVDTKKLVLYVVGRFNILDGYELKNTDLFESGVVALEQSVDYPQTLIEHVYTADQRNVSSLQKMLQTGLDVKLEKTLDLAAVVHVERLPNGSLQCTVVPLLYGGYALKQGSGTFSLEPPLDLNLEAGLPLVKTEMLQEALKTYAAYKRKTAPENALAPPPMPATSASPTPSYEELVRTGSGPLEEISVDMPTVHTKGAKGAVTPAPVVAQATPALAKAVPSPALTTALLSTPRPIAPPRPTAPRPLPTAVPVATPLAVSPQGVPLTPFLQSAPAPNLAQNSGGNWHVYPPGQVPRGRLIQPGDAPELADRGLGGERLYLRGQFIVTASGENRAVLRPQGGGFAGFGKSTQGSTRIIVEFPVGAQPPSEGATFSRNEDRPFQVTDIRRGADGQINVYVREVTAP